MPWEFFGGGIFGIICGIMNTKHAILALAAVAASLLAVADDPSVMFSVIRKLKEGKRE